MTLGEKITQLRVEHNESLQELADSIGITKAHLWEMEKNRSKNPSLSILQKLANHFKISIDSLVGNENASSIQAYGREFENLSPKSLEVLKKMAKFLKESETERTEETKKE
ncbi:MAG: helix-turn-helix transcriptional regulator [Alphaproteobacteria bacterium]|nr:helix-turn-helix transcriptional regulator [Alphaproteobacteria bacterium]